MTDQHPEHIVVLGASPKPERYSNQCIRLLQDYGYNNISPVNPALTEIEGYTVTNDIETINEPVHTLTMYVGEARSVKIHDEILALKPQRVIFNPGSEAPKLQNELEQQGAEVIEGCTLVMLKTNQF